MFDRDTFSCIYHTYGKSLVRITLIMPDDFFDTILGKIKVVPLSLIDIDVSARRPADPGHIKELSDSIRSRGLINPITLYQTPNSLRYRLIAGAHRYYAMKALNYPASSARVYEHELGQYELKAIELFENIHRKDITQVERQQQLASLHELMQATKGPSTTGSRSVGHRIKDTARIAGVSVGTVAGALKLRKAIQDFPELGLDKIASETEALRTLQRFAAVISNQHIASQAANREDTLTQSYILGDFFENTLASESYAIIECDPPYGIDLAGLRKSTDTTHITTDYSEVSEQDYTGFIMRLCREVWRLASPNSWFILWFANQHYQLCSDALRTCGFLFHPVPAIWKKGNSMGQSQAPDSVLGNAYESFFWARKGSPKLHVAGRSNIFDHPVVPAQQKIHPTERPVELVADILRTFSWPGMPVLCPFLGSGNTLIAAQSLGMPCIGFELTENYRNAFVARMMRGKKDA